MKGHPAGFAQLATQTNSSAMSQARHQNPNFRIRKLIFRELDLPFETAPKTTRESTITRSRRARTPSRVVRLRRLIRLSSSRRLMCLTSENRQENIVVQFHFIASGAAAARPSSSPIQSRRTWSPSLRQNRTGRANRPG